MRLKPLEYFLEFEKLALLNQGRDVVGSRVLIHELQEGCFSLGRRELVNKAEPARKSSLFRARLVAG
ncbi:hypothetical protein GCM10011378_22000 [Hymenobacter glacieicola]|uniref:Uncharacterized protein n=1 Tax=Hymenobacter glacieicola TaxID=1562124 RepID=A0ABQ1WWK8_9BACT|nr:hypothetical protein GCM10011378_22000 [Hymenobacter glacieicola]